VYSIILNLYLKEATYLYLCNRAKAINKNPGLLKSSGRNLDVFEYLREKGEIKDETITYIDAPTVVWEAIKWWQNIHNWLGG
jgi:hypothetical protein